MFDNEHPVCFDSFRRAHRVPQTGANIMRTAIEALFDSIVSDGWANRSDGDVEAPTGHFALVSNSANELTELRQAFEDIIVTYGNVSDADLTGHFIVVRDSYGNVDVTRYPSAVSAVSEFVTMSNRYARWTGND